MDNIVNEAKENIKTVKDRKFEKDENNKAKEIILMEYRFHYYYF